MLSNNTTRAGRLVVTGCAAMALISTGCRSMPGMGMFGMGSKPSVETIAAGPTTSFPAPPSASATPEAIASIAGGTGVPVSTGQPESAPGLSAPGTSAPGLSATAQAGGQLPGYASSPKTNLAAAQANGFGTPATPAGYTPTKPSGYSFGAKTFTPKTEAPSAPSAPTPSTSYALPGSGSPTAPTGMTAPAGVTAPAQTSTPGGFTLPGGVSPAVAAATAEPPSFGLPAGGATASIADTKPAGFAPPSDLAPPAATAPDFSTASTADVTAPSTTLDSLPALAPPSATSDVPSGYSPGSTAGAGGYPTGSSAPTTNGSFYR